jgi:LPXTG-motif cell wall-anchored protein
MKRLLLLGTVAFTVLFMGVAHASTSVSWTGGQDQGSENLPCSDGGHWILSPAQGITSATLTFEGHTYVMEQSGGGSYSVDTDGSISVGDTATATYEGNNDSAFLKLSHCTSGGTPSPTDTGTPSPTETDTGTPTDTESPTSSSSTPTTSVKGESGTRTPKHPGGGTGGTAFTGSDATPYTVAAIGLLGLGLAGLYIARRRAARSFEG